MAVRRPTLDQLRSVAEDLGMHMGDEELKSYDALMQANYAAYEAVDAMPDYVPAVKYPRTPGYRPEGEENKYNAWYYKSSVKGANEGKLKGKTVVLKDNCEEHTGQHENCKECMRRHIPTDAERAQSELFNATGNLDGDEEQL